MLILFVSEDEGNSSGTKVLCLANDPMINEKIPLLYFELGIPFIELKNVRPWPGAFRQTDAKAHSLYVERPFGGCNEAGGPLSPGPRVIVQASGELE